MVQMRRQCPNFDREDGLEGVLEVPIPEEILTSMGNNPALRWQNMRMLMKYQGGNMSGAAPWNSGRSAELQLLNVVGSPLVPPPIKDISIETSTAKYIVQQYIAATGGQAALNSANSMYAIGNVRMSASEFHMGDESVNLRGNGEVEGFVLWQKNPDLWYLELLVSACKVSAGNDGKVAWPQFASQQSHSSKGPPRPLHRSLQELLL